MTIKLNYEVEIHLEEIPRAKTLEEAEEYHTKLTRDIDRVLSDLDLYDHAVEYIDVREA